MRKWKSLKPLFADTWHRHKKAVIVCAAAIVAFVGCLLLVLCAPAKSKSARAAEGAGVDVPAGGSGGDAGALAGVPAAEDDEMAKRMEEIYAYLVQLDAMVTDNQSTLEEVRLQSDAGLQEDEAVSEVQVRLRGDVVNLGTRMGDLHQEITATKELITLLKESSQEGHTVTREQLVSTFSRIEKSMQTIEQEFNSSIADMEKLIEAFQNDDASRHETIIQTLSSMKESMTDAQKESVAALSDTLSQMRADYEKALEDLQTRMDGGFSQLNDDIGSRLDESRKSTEEKVDTLDGRMSGKLNDLSEKFDEQNGRLGDSINTLADSTKDGFTSINTYLTNVFGVQEENGESLLDRLSAYHDQVTRSFTSVSNGKKLLADALLTKGSDVGGNILSREDIETRADSIPFQTYYEAIMGLSQEYKLDSGKGAKGLTIAAHFHGAGSAEKTQTFSSWDEYSAYASAHRAGSTSTTGGGCYSSTKHQDYVYMGKVLCGEWIFLHGAGGGSVGTNYWRCSGCGEEATNQSDGHSTGWGMGYHYKDSYEYVTQNYYDLKCSYQQGQILSVELQF